MPGSSHERAELAYHQLWHQLIGEPLFRAARPALKPFLHPLPHAIR
jgi:hypothetical protein